MPRNKSKVQEWCSVASSGTLTTANKNYINSGIQTSYIYTKSGRTTSLWYDNVMAKTPSYPAGQVVQ